jgi:tetratricopeptide (TPR) repeat protein
MSNIFKPTIGLFLGLCLATLLLSGCGSSTPARKPRTPTKPTTPVKPDTKAADAKAAPTPATANKVGTKTSAPSDDETAATEEGDDKSEKASKKDQPRAAQLPPLPSAKSITVEPVDYNWTPEKKIEQTSLRMKKIVLAIQEYVKTEGKLPPVYVVSKSDAPLLSWRVAILPYLGYEETFKKFQLNATWDSGKNKKAMTDAMPEEYKSPWSDLEHKTTFLVPRSPKGLFGQLTGVTADSVTDQWSETIALLMVDDDRAVEWTRPQDFNLRPGASPGLLGRQLGGFLAAFADGNVNWVDLAVGRDKLPPLFTIQGGEKFVISTLIQPPAKAVEAIDKFAKLSQEVIPEIKGNLFPEMEGFDQDFNSSSDSRSPSDTNEVKEDKRGALPTEEEEKIANSTLLKIFEKDIKEWSKGNKYEYHKKFSTVLMETLEKLDADPPAAYVLLRTAHKNALEIGDYNKAMEAYEELTKRYQINNAELKFTTIKTASENLLPYHPSQNDTLKNDCMELLLTTIREDNFVVAKQLVKIHQECVQRSVSGTSTRPMTPTKNGTSNRNELARAQSMVKEVDDLSRAYQPVVEALELLKQEPTNADANTTIGKYYCFIKSEWKKGAPYLAKSDSIKLKVLGAEESQGIKAPQTMAEVAGQYYDLAEVEPAIFRRGLHFRAAYWYQLALNSLPNNRLKISAERNLETINEQYGEDNVSQATERMNENSK